MTKTNVTLAMSLLLAGSLLAQNAKQIADSLEIPELKPGAKQLSMPKVPAGVDIELLGADYEQLINKQGKIAPVLSETPVNVSFKVKKDGKEEISKDYQLLLKPAKASSGNPKPQVVPEILQWRGAQGDYQLDKTITVTCPDKDLSKIFAQDLKEVTGKNVTVSPKADNAAIRFEIIKNNDLGKEGYRMNITKAGVKIEAATNTGLLWGTRTLLQMLRQTPNAVPCGAIVDIPRYQVRGFMLDIARTPYPLSYLKDIIRAMSWYKMNDLHLVINNNYIFHEHYVDNGKDPFKETYSAFRLESDMKGKDGQPLTAQDLSYSKKEFIDLINYAKKYGVTIVPEFDTPGHALSFTRVRPDLIYKGPMGNKEKRRCEMLDAANPETVRFVGQVLDEYLLTDPKLGQAVMQDCPVIHVGADEFFGGAEDYRQFADALLKYALKRGYTPRIWGSLSHKPGKTPVQSKGVQMNLWSQNWMRPWEAIKQGYDVINTNDGDLYCVPFANYYRMDRNHKKLYNNWLPNRVGSALLPAGHPQLLGATFAFWNDETDIMHTGYSPQDLWAPITGSMDVLSQKMWGKAQAPDSFEQHRDLVAKIGDVPGVNPWHVWKDKKPLAVTNSGTLNKPAIGGKYRIKMDVELQEAPQGVEQALLSGPQGQFLAVMKDGTIGFRRDDTLEFSFGEKLPVGKKVTLELVGEPEKTQLFIDGKPAGQATLQNYAPKAKDFTNFKHRPKVQRSTFIAPLQKVGAGLKGKVHNIHVQPE